MPESSTAELIHRIATEVYENRRPQKAVLEALKAENSDAFGSLSESRISRLLDMAWKTGMLRLNFTANEANEERLERDTELERDAELERKLMRGFGLQHAFVVSTLTWEYPGVYDVALLREQDTHRHNLLGHALAQRLPAVLRSGDHIAVTGGRPGYECALRLNELRPLPFRDITVSSLSGRLSSVHMDRGGPRVMDADDVCLRLFPAFESATPKPLSFPLALASRELVSQIMQAEPGNALDAAAWRASAGNALVPDIALVGVASLHPLSFFARIAMGMADMPIRAAINALEDLWTCRDPNAFANPTAAYYHPVGDIADNYFYVPPPPGLAQSSCEGGGNIEAQVARIMREEIRPKLLAVTLDQLRSVRKVIVTAGGPFKVDPLLALLTMDKEYLFEVDLTLASITNGGEIPPALQAAFAAAGVRLSPAARISMDPGQKQWLVSEPEGDERSGYWVVPQGSSLVTYRRVRPFIHELCTDATTARELLRRAGKSAS